MGHGLPGVTLGESRFRRMAVSGAGFLAPTGACLNWMWILHVDVDAIYPCDVVGTALLMLVLSNWPRYLERCHGTQTRPYRLCSRPGKIKQILSTNLVSHRRAVDRYFCLVVEGFMVSGADEEEDVGDEEW